MATQNYIIKLENLLINARLDTQAINQAIEIERKGNSGYVPLNNSAHAPYVTGTLLNKENRDCWGTLYVNACALRRELDAVITSLKTEFGE